MKAVLVKGGWRSKEEEIDFEKGEGKIFEFRQVYIVFQW